jgi:hypothetical protein
VPPLIAAKPGTGCWGEWLNPGHLAFFVKAAVDQFDLSGVRGQVPLPMAAAGLATHRSRRARVRLQRLQFLPAETLTECLRHGSGKEHRSGPVSEPSSASL